MTNQVSDLQGFAARLAGGPAFLVFGSSYKSDSGSVVPEFQWSGVYTTETASDAGEPFRQEWRTISSVGAMSVVSSRSQTDLQVNYLLGATHLPDDQKPATDVLEAADARHRAVQELARLASETVTPRGTVVLDSWSPNSQLPSSDWVPALRALGPGQGHLFAADTWSDDAYVASLAKSGQLVLHTETLAEALASLAETGAVKLSDPVSAGRTARHVIAIGEGFAEIDIHTWNQIRRSARPVDLELLTPPIFSSGAARYQEFRAFAGATEGSPRWRGIIGGMNIERDFESALAKMASDLLHQRNLPEPIVLSGQTATGKSVALANLSVSLARQGTFAVLHQSRRTVRPSFDDIDMYAAWAEEHGAAGTVLIWDGMVNPGEYEALARQLRNRGRKVLVIGSAYLTRSDSSHVIEAPAELSTGESGRLLKLLKTFGIDVNPPRAALDSSFLAFLYYLLPDTESALRHGLASELRSAELGMQQLVRERGSQPSASDRMTAMAAALHAAGITLDDKVLDKSDDPRPLAEQSFGERSPIQRVTTLVLVAGRHGVPVPIDLALRILGREGSQSIRDALLAFDIIREVDDDNGEYFLTARSPLEAELLAQHEIPLEVEIEVVTEAIRSVRVMEGYAGGADEIQFVVSLLERIGPTSDASRYRRYFLAIADALRDRREELGRPHPRLVLQESHFTRGFVEWQQKAQQGSARERIATLEHNRDLLEEVLGDPQLRGLMRLSLTVELASTLGAIMYEIQADGEETSTGTLVSRLDDILRAVLEARAIDPGNLYPVDVLAWSTRNAIQAGDLSLEERLDRLANAVATIESIDRTSVSEKQRAQLDRRSLELHQLLGDDDAVWTHLRELESNADPAATYFLAKLESDSGIEGESAALARLWRGPAVIHHDWRCAQLLLDLAWRDITGNRLLRGERVPLHLSSESLAAVDRLTSVLSAADLPDRYKLLFVDAIAHFVRGRFADSIGMFREVENLTRQQARRLHTALVLADESGEPIIFTGRVESVHGRWGKVRVEELGTSVSFEPGLFSASHDFAMGQKLPAFMVGFKLTRGAVAEPRSMFRDARIR